MTSTLRRISSSLCDICVPLKYRAAPSSYTVVFPQLHSLVRQFSTAFGRAISSEARAEYDAMCSRARDKLPMSKDTHGNHYSSSERYVSGPNIVAYPGNSSARGAVDPRGECPCAGPAWDGRTSSSANSGKTPREVVCSCLWTSGKPQQASQPEIL